MQITHFPKTTWNGALFVRPRVKQPQLELLHALRAIRCPIHARSEAACAVFSPGRGH